MRLKSTVLFLALGAALPTVLPAQSCVGMPGSSLLTVQTCLVAPPGQQGMVFAGVATPEGATTYSLGAAAGVGQPVAASFGYSRISPENGGEGLDRYSLGLSVDLSQGAGVFAAATGSANYISKDGVTNLSFPVGVAIGTSLPLGQSGALQLAPYLTPQVIHYRFSSETLGGSFTHHDTYVGASAGASLQVGALSLGASLEKVFEENTDPVLSVQAGIGF